MAWELVFEGSSSRVRFQDMGLFDQGPNHGALLLCFAYAPPNLGAFDARRQRLLDHQAPIQLLQLGQLDDG